MAEESRRLVLELRLFIPTLLRVFGIVAHNSEHMTSSGIPRDHFASAPMQDSVTEVGKLVQTELYGLLKRRGGITQRIRSLRRVLRGLREGVGRPAVDGFPVGSAKHDQSTGQRNL
jgi:hypothetical protein